MIRVFSNGSIEVKGQEGLAFNINGKRLMLYLDKIEVLYLEYV